MDVIFGGRFENAFMAACDSDGTPPQRGHPYYDSLMRPTAPAVFHRCGTFLALGEAIRMPGVDWRPGQMRADRDQLDIARLGLVSDDDFDIHEPCRRFAAELLLNRAIRPAALGPLKIDPWPTDLSPRLKGKREVIDGRPPVNQAQHDQLSRLLSQVHLAQKTGAYLILGEDEIEVLRQVATYVVAKKIHPPFDLPNVAAKNLVDADRFAGGLIHYTPPDLEAALAVREDKSVRRYAELVATIVESPEVENLDRDLVRAAREQFRDAQRLRATQRVFEILKFVFKPVPVLNMVPGPMGTLIKRERRERSWNVLAARMSDIAINDWLARKDNY